MRRIRVGLVITAIAASACGPFAGDPVVDGWPIGSETNCSIEDRCPELLTTAQVGFDRRSPGHPAVVAVTLHLEGRLAGSDSGEVLYTRSGSCCWVARFELADGTVRAIGVGYPGVSETAVVVDVGP
jgi:hypothetical protein